MKNCPNGMKICVNTPVCFASCHRTHKHKQDIWHAVGFCQGVQADMKYTQAYAAESLGS